MADSSFDVVSKVDRQEVDNALNQAEKEIANLHRQQLASQTGALLDQAVEAGKITVLTHRLPDGISGGDLRTVATDLRGRLAGKPGVVVLASADGEKLPFIVGATREAIELGVKSGDLVKLLSGYVDGRGGGKPDMAQGSGANPAGLDAGFHAVREELAAL